MKFFTPPFVPKMLILFSAFFYFLNDANAATLFENFDNPSIASSTHSAKDITYSSGMWNVCGITKSNPPKEEDKLIGLNSIRLWGRTAGQTSLSMKFNKAGAGVVSIKYCSYGNHSGGKFKIQQSINDGSSWTDIGSEVTVPAWSGTFLTYSVNVNHNGNIRFRIEMTATTGTNEKINVDEFMVTDYGTEQVAMPVSTVTTGVYESAQSVSLSTTTAGATIYYTTDGSTPTSSSMVYSTPLNISATTRLRAIAIADGKVDSREEEILISFPEQIATIAELYSKMAASGTNLSYFKFTGEAIVTASYTATYKTLFLQDNTAGILISDFNKKINNTYNTGDKITSIIAQVNRINDSPQLYPYADFTVLSSGNTIVPPVITLANVPNYTYQLVQINNLTFTEANGTKTFGPNSPYIITDASATSTTTTFRTPSGMPNPDYINTVIPDKRNIICLIAKNSSAVTTHYLFARNAADLNVQATDIQTAISNYFKISGNTLLIDSPESLQVRIYNVGGQLIKSFTTNIGVNNLELAKGVYIIRIGEKSAKVMM
jgi:hypothetical protein